MFSKTIECVKTVIRPLERWTILGIVAIAVFIGLSQIYPSYAQVNLTKEQFISKLDLSKPGLEEIQKFAAQQQWQKACAAYGAHLKKRETPRWFFAYRDKPPVNPDANVSEAREALNNVVYFAGHRFELNSDINWNRDFRNTGTLEWNAWLNRMPFVQKLAKAYVESGDEAFANKAIFFMRDWMNKLSPNPNDRGVEPYIGMWNVLSESIRSFWWIDAFYYLLSADEFTDDFACDMAITLSVAAEHLQQFGTRFGKPNWMGFEGKALYGIGQLLDEHTQANLWRTTAQSRIKDIADNGFYPDGSQIELTSYYGWIASTLIREWLELADLNNLASLSISNHLDKTLEKFFEYSTAVLAPDLYLPNVNDAYRLDGVWEFGRVIGRHPDRLDFLWVASARSQGTKPSFTSRFFPYAGQFSMRSDWESDGVHLFFEAGPTGALHAHADKLSVLYSAFGKELLIEGGIYYPYGNNPGSKYTFSSQAHNTVTINDLSQVVTPESRVLPTPWKPLDLPWYSSDQFDYGSGEYNDGYGQERIKVRHQRSVVFRKNRNYAVLFDRLIPTSSEPYRSQILFHLNSEGDIIRDNNNVASTQNTGANLTIHPVSSTPMSLEVVKGKKQEPIQGFADRGRQWLPVPTLVYSSKHQGPQAFAWVLSPQRPHEKDQIDTITAVDLVTTTPSDAQALKITFKDGTSEIILCSGNYTGAKTFAGITTSAHAGVYKLVGQNVTERHEYNDVD